MYAKFKVTLHTYTQPSTHTAKAVISTAKHTHSQGCNKHTLFTLTEGQTLYYGQNHVRKNTCTVVRRGAHTDTKTRKKMCTDKDLGVL